MAPRMKVETSADQPTPKAVSTTPKKASTAAPKPVVAPAPTSADSVVEAAAPKPVSAPKPVDTVIEAPAPKPAPKPAEAPMPRLVEAPVNEPTPEQDQAQYYAYAEAPGPIPTPDPIPASDSTQAHDSAQDRARAHGSSDDQAPKQKRDINDMRHAVSGWVHRTFPGREHAFWGGVIALVVAVLVFAIGLPRMLFICLLVVVGVAIGQIADGDPKIIRAITSLFNSDRDQS